MSIGFENPTVPERSQESPVDGYWFPEQGADGAAAMAMAQYAAVVPPVPGGGLPSLARAPDEMDTRSATMFHVSVCRWLEHLLIKVAELELKASLRGTELDLHNRILKHKYGSKLDKCSIDELDDLNRREWEHEKAKAELTAARAILAAQEKVRAATSRTITANTKTNPSFGD